MTVTFNTLCAAVYAHDDEALSTILRIIPDINDPALKAPDIVVRLIRSIGGTPSDVYGIVLCSRLDLLLKAGLNPDASTTEGWPLLAIAAGFQNAEAVRLLLQANANANAADTYGNTPLLYILDVLRANKHRPTAVAENIIAALLAAKADPNIADNAGNTPLMLAASLGSLAIVNQLLAAKADPTLERNALQIAKWHGYQQIADALEAAIANWIPETARP